jgi:DNA replication and repair protein RecF
VELRRLWLTDFRSYEQLTLELPTGLTAVLGPNGEGKTNLLEAIAYLATLSSFRGAPAEALVRRGAAGAVVRAEAEREGRALLIEAELGPTGRHRVLLNRQRLGRARDLLGALRVSVFAPDDLVLVKGGPEQRRRYLDEALVGVQPRHDALRTDLERVLRQRNALLRSAGGRLDADAARTLDVWDAKLVEVGEALAGERAVLVERLVPRLRSAYDEVARQPAEVTAAYDAPWRADGLAAVLAGVRNDELRRGVSLVGPHRDELVLGIGGLPARTHASQGEQRSLALALRLAAHAEVAAAAGSPPVLLLDDVFSELDPDRSDALLTSLPPGQTVLTSAAGLPPQARPDLVLRIAGGTLR